MSEESFPMKNGEFFVGLEGDGEERIAGWQAGNHHKRWTNVQWDNEVSGLQNECPVDGMH